MTVHKQHLQRLKISDPSPCMHNAFGFYIKVRNPCLLGLILLPPQCRRHLRIVPRGRHLVGSGKAGGGPPKTLARLFIFVP